MAEWCRFSVCFWHTFRGKGADPFGFPTIERPWDYETDTLENAYRRARAAFEFMSKLGIEYYTFHDRDVAPEGKTLQETNDNFDKLKDAAFLGKRSDTNKFLSDTIFENEKNIFYINSINQRLVKLLEINNNGGNIEKAVSNLKPPVFWKDKPNLISQAKVWDKKKIKLMMKNTYNIEIKIKNNSSIDKHILIKKLLVDMCELANAS